MCPFQTVAAMSPGQEAIHGPILDAKILADPVDSDRTFRTSRFTAPMTVTVIFLMVVGICDRTSLFPVSSSLKKLPVSSSNANSVVPGFTRQCFKIDFLRLPRESLLITFAA